MQTQSAYIAQK